MRGYTSDLRSDVMWVRAPKHEIIQVNNS